MLSLAIARPGAEREPSSRRMLFDSLEALLKRQEQVVQTASAQIRMVIGNLLESCPIFARTRFI